MRKEDGRALGQGPANGKGVGVSGLGTMKAPGTGFGLGWVCMERDLELPIVIPQVAVSGAQGVMLLPFFLLTGLGPG